MAEQWIVHLSLRHSYGIREFARDCAVPVAIEFNSPRAVDELKAGIGTVALEDAVVMMKRRQIRREVLRATAIRLAEQIADTIEDAEGWHGEDRQRAAGSL